MEDNQSDVFLIEEAIHGANLPLSVRIVKDGAEAIDFFEQIEGNAALSCPDLLVLDINLPRRSGIDVLRHLRTSGRCRQTRVIAISTSDSDLDREKMKDLGADAYFRKPSDYDEFMKLGEVIAGLLGPEF